MQLELVSHFADETLSLSPLSHNGKEKRVESSSPDIHLRFTGRTEWWWGVVNWSGMHRC